MSEIYKEELKKLLREIPQLSPQDREYVMAAFSKHIGGGLQRWEAEKILRGLKLNIYDLLKPYEVEKIKQKILSFFGK